jgi:hypothetical protein
MQSYSELLSEEKLSYTYITLKFSKLRSNFSKHSEKYFIYELEVGPFKGTGKIYNKLDSVTRDQPILTGKPLVHTRETPVLSRGRPVHSRDRLVTIGGIRTPGGSDSSGNCFT